MEVILGGILNGTDYDYKEDYEYIEDPEQNGSEVPVFLLALYTVVVVVGLLGNALLLRVLAQKRQYWRISDTFILHMGVTDILLLLTLPFWAVQANQPSGWCFGVVLCKICGAVFSINFYSGIFLLVCISLDRCLSIIYSTQLFSRKKPVLAHISCLLVWIISLLLSIPDFIFLVAEKDQAEANTLCDHNYSDWLLLSRLLHLTVGFLLPVVTLIICCSCFLLWPRHSSKGLLKQRTIILALVVVFFCFWVPYNITLIVDTYRNRSKEPLGLSKNQGSLQTALKVTSVLACIHACLRPLLYLGLCGNFRKRALAILRCATLEPKSSVWELGVGEEVLCDQGQEEEEMKQMTIATSGAS
nr:C-X-C chemokine receptor type 3-like isoform X2 [Monopterus albus]